MTAWAEQRNAGPAARTRVSVITAFLDAERFLPDAIESVLAQTFPRWELLLIDDGSADHSSGIAQEYAAQYSDRIRYLTHEGRVNRGPAASRNLGLTRAVGEYVAVLDADDMWEPRRLERQVDFLDAHPEVALVGSWYREIDSGGRPLRRGRKPGKDLDIRWAMLFYCPFLHSSVLFRRDPVLEQVGGYDERLLTSQDFELWTRIVGRFRVANLREYLVRYRVHDASLTSRHGTTAQIGHRLRVSRAGELAGWEEDFELRQSRLDAMSRLLSGDPEGLGAAELHRSVHEIFRLHEAFCHESGLTGEAAERHRTRLRAEVAHNLVVLAASLALHRRRGAASLLRRAFQLHPRAFFRRRTVTRSLGLLLRPLLVGRGSKPGQGRTIGRQRVP